MVAMVFLVVHILTTLLDSYVPTGWFSAVIPLTSKYEPVHVALGAVAFDLMLAVWVSSLLEGEDRQPLVAFHPLVQLAGPRERASRTVS